MPSRPIILASSSPYRRELLSRLRLPFTSADPAIDETPQTAESGPELARRLSLTKAKALAGQFPDHWIIGSDQVATMPGGELAHKPGDHQAALEQLRTSSGQTVTFHTGLTLLDSASGLTETLCEAYQVHFRHLSESEIEHYLQAEKPYDCAGSFRMEGLGIALFSALEGRDPNSLVGLPLMALTDMLRKRGINPLLSARGGTQPG